MIKNHKGSLVPDTRWGLLFICKKFPDHSRYLESSGVGWVLSARGNLNYYATSLAML